MTKNDKNLSTQNTDNTKDLKEKPTGDVSKNDEQETVLTDEAKPSENDSNEPAEKQEKKVAINVKNIRKIYRLGSEKVVALNKVNLKIMQGEICCIVGTSGSGKSTLLNQLAGLEKPTKGAVYIYNKNISKMSENTLAKLRQKFIGFIFQSYNLLPMLTALENVGMPLMFKGVPKFIRNKKARKMLKAVGLGKRYKHKPTQMSGGQQQRVGIARAFVANPKIVFADEPTGNLDTKTTMEVMELMVKMCKKFNQTLIIVTHDRELSLFADRVVTLIDGNIVSDIINHDVVTTAEEAMKIMEEEMKQTIKKSESSVS